ncbi:tetratricopeptide repeat protein [Nesterenkonia alba]|uniref:tetratricopeptide repeat protein n=1 Tax=Nesterenkonia alba TaxID=515814 RepID=UPI0003B2F09B|nr:tetratricopeptide repeat protein [Nesterenkonia alba]
MLKPLILGAEAARRALQAVTRIPGADLTAARAVVASGKLVPRPVETELTGQRSRAQKLHAQAANVLFETNASGAEKLLTRLNIAEITDADLLERLAVRYLRLRRHDAVLQMRQRAAELEPDNPARHLALARSLLRGGGEGIIRDPVVGLTPGPGVRQAEVRATLDRAAALAPDNPAVLRQRGQFEAIHGDPHAGLQLMERAAALRPDADLYIALGKEYRKPGVLRLDDAAEAYARALRLRPGDSQILRSVITLGCRGAQDWEWLYRIARDYETHRTRGEKQRRVLEHLDRFADLFTTETSTSGQISTERAQAATEALVSQPHGPSRRGSHRGAQQVRLSWPVTALIGYRLQFAGHLGLGYRIREHLAERTLQWLGTTSGGHTGHRQKVLAALIYLGRGEQAQRLIDPMPWTPHTDLGRLQLRKLAADVHLTQGRVQPYLEYSQQVRQAAPLPAEAEMERLVAGKRVAVVGPVDTGDQLGELIDTYDVVVRPRFAPDFVTQQRAAQGSRTDVAYVNGQDLDAMAAHMSQAHRAGQLHLAVARPLSVARDMRRDEPWLRYARQDLSVTYHGAPLGIPRMIYDLLQFHPAEIAVFNTDLYSGTQAFGAGYRQAKDFGFGPHSALNDLVVSHDLLFDFRFLTTLHRAGLLTAHGRVAEVLAMSETDYITAVETGGALR